MLQRNVKIGIALEGPIKEYREISSKLSVYAPADYVKLSKTKTPSLGLKYAIEAVRCIVDRNFRPGRNHLEEWTASVNSLSKKNFSDQILKFDPNKVTTTQLKRLLGILRSQDLKEQRLVTEAPLAADLCKWARIVAGFAAYVSFYVQQSTMDVFRSNKKLKGYRRIASEFSQQLSSKQEQLNNLKEEQQSLERRLASLTREIKQYDRSIQQLDKLIFYRQRGDIILRALSKLQKR